MNTQIILTGEILHGHDLVTVKRKFAQLHKIPISQAEMYFTGQPQVLKVESDPQKAKDIQATYTRIGAQCVLKELKPKPSVPVTETSSSLSSTLKQAQKKITQEAQEIKSSHISYSSKSEYGITRIIARIFAGIGVLFLLVGIIYFFAAITAGEDKALSALIWGMIGGFGIIGGLFLILAGQITKAIVDMTDNSVQLVELQQNMLTLLKK